MASTIKARQKKQLKQDLSKAAQSISTALNPRIKSAGTYPAAKATLIRTTLDPVKIAMPKRVKIKQLNKKKKRKK